MTTVEESRLLLLLCKNTQTGLSLWRNACSLERPGCHVHPAGGTLGVQPLDLTRDE